jgi:hypothetical protein
MRGQHGIMVAGMRQSVNGHISGADAHIRAWGGCRVPSWGAAGGRGRQQQD